MASRKKVLLKVRTVIEDVMSGLVLIWDPQVIILGDSGVGKTSLMNQYVRWIPTECLSIATYTLILETDTGLGQQEIQCKLQGDHWGGFLDKGGPSRR